MAIAVNDLVTEVKDYNPRLQASSHDARILRWLNQSRRWGLNEVGLSTADDLDMRSSTINLTADEPLYPLPDDFYDLDVVTRKNTGGSYEISTRRGRETFRKWVADGKTYGDEEFYHALRGMFLDLKPIPAAAVTAGLQLDYFYWRSDWTAGNDIETYWNPFTEFLVIGAALRSDIRNFDRRRNLEIQHDNRLVPQFKRRFSSRTTEPRSMGDIRNTASRRAMRAGRFGRTG